MDAWEWNKIAAAVLGALVLALGLRFASEKVFTVPPLPHPAYVPPVPEKPLVAAPADAAAPANGAAAGDANGDKPADKPASKAKP